MKKNKCLLSVAMIVKDEEHNIRRALESLKGVVDEIIVVDTGSKDRTPEIVKEYTDKLFFHEWKDDFSEARNYSLKFPTCEWVLIFDADEELSEDFRKNIRNFLMNLPGDVNTIYVPTISYLDIDLKRTEFAATPRIFRNGTVYYKNIVHNQPVHKPKSVNIPYVVYHYGYIWTRKTRKRKYNRTRSLILKHLENVQDPVEKIYYLVQLYKTESIGDTLYRKYEVAWKALSEIRKVGKIPSIGLEFLYLFSMDLINADILNLARELLKMDINIIPDYPDPYFGMLTLSERSEKWHDVIEWGNKFLDVLDKALNRIEKYEWTVMTVKNIASAYMAIARAYLKLGNYEHFFENMKEAIKKSEETGENIQKFLSVILGDICSMNLEKKDLEKLIPAVGYMLEISSQKNLNLKADCFFEKVAEMSLRIPEEILDRYNPSNEFGIIVKKRLTDKRDHLMDVILKGKTIEEFVLSEGASALLLIFDVISESDEEKLRILNNIRKETENSNLKGATIALMGDIYLRMGRYREAITMYRKSIEIAPDISKFVKPVIEDLKIKLESDVEGVYEELLRYFTGGKELIFDLTKYLGKDISKKLHLISDNPYAYYTAAICSEDPQITLELLRKIPNPDKFPFYYYRMAKAYEKIDNKKAFELHIKACEKNEKLADITLGKYIYTGLYPNTTFSFMKNDDEIVWVGNLSEKFSTLGIIHPVRSWRKCEKGFLYSYPYPDDEALRIYKDREEKIYRERPFIVKAEDVLKVMSRPDWKVTKIFPEELEKEYRWVFEELEIEIKDHSKNIVVVEGIEEIPDLKDVLKDIKEAVIFFHVPNLGDREDPVWFYPRFRILRSTSYMKKELRNLGYEVLGLEVLSKNLRCIHIKKE